MSRLRFIAITCVVLLEGCSETVGWTEEVALHDGRVINVERQVILKTTGKGEIVDAFNKWPTQYSVRAKHPDTGDVIKWAGEDHINPIMLDFIDGIPYMVVLPWSIYADMKPYACPNPPYAFIRYEGHSAGWKSVNRELAPRILRRTNLSATFDGFYIKGRKPRRSSDQVKSANQLLEHSTNGFFQSTIPENIEAWRYHHKNDKSARHDGC